MGDPLDESARTRRMFWMNSAVVVGAFVAAFLSIQDVIDDYWFVLYGGFFLIWMIFQIGRGFGQDEELKRQRKLCFRETWWCQYCGSREIGLTTCAYRNCVQGLAFDEKATNAGGLEFD